jgi:hypothetical protein
MSDPPVYVMFGHGIEIPLTVRGRNALPEGVTLVTIAECGTGLQHVGMVNILAELLQNKQRAANPTLQNFKDAYLDLHIFKGDDKDNNEHPTLFYEPVTSLVGGSYATISGVVRLDSITEEVSDSLTEEVIEASQESIERMYRNSLFPRAKDVRLEDGKISYPTVPIERVFEELGPGVYYFAGCRNFTHSVPERHAELLKRMSNEKQQGRGKRMKKRLTKRRKYGARRTTMRLV